MSTKTELFVSQRSMFPIVEEMLSDGRDVRFTVSGNSMWPVIAHQRDSVLLTPCAEDELKKGDIILFRATKTHWVLHRITEVLEDGYITTGDGNLHRDPFIPKEAVRGKVKTIYRKERAIDCSAKRWRALFRLWMIAFPVRGTLQKAIIKMKQSPKA